MKTINDDPTKLTAEALKNGIVKHQSKWAKRQIDETMNKREIKDEIAKWSESDEVNHQKKLKSITDKVEQAWRDIVGLKKITDQDIQEILGEKDKWGDYKGKHSKSSDEARQNILKLYSYETNLYKAINKANAKKDEEAIETLGPYAKLLYMTLEHPPETNAKEQARVTRGDVRKRIEEGEQVQIGWGRIEYKYDIYYGDDPHQRSLEL